MDVANGDSLASFSYEIGIGNPKVWRTNSLTVHAEYLRCPLTADDLKARFGITRIPHGAPANVFARLLSGLSSGMGPASPTPIA